MELGVFKKKRRNTEEAGKAQHFRCCSPRSARAAFPPKRRSPSGFLLRGAESAGHTWGTNSRPCWPGGRARGSPGSPSGAGRDHSAGTEGGKRPRARVAAGLLSPFRAVAAASTIDLIKWREDGLCGDSGLLEGGGRLTSSLSSPLLALDAPGSGLPLGPALLGEPRSEPRQLARAEGEAGPRGSPPPPLPVPSPSGPLRSAGRRRFCAPLPGAAAAAGLGSSRTRSAERAAMPERDRRQPIGGRRGREPSLRTGQRDGGRRR